MLHSEVLITDDPDCLRSPWFLLNILPGITEEVKISQECVVDDVVPGEFGRRGGAGSRGCVVLLKRGFDSLRSCFQSLCNVLS